MNRSALAVLALFLLILAALLFHSFRRGEGGRMRSRTNPEESVRERAPDKTRASVTENEPAVGPPPEIQRLNELQQSLSAGLAEGGIRLEEILGRFRQEAREDVLEVLAAVLRENTIALGDSPSAVAGLLHLARNDSLPARRRNAVFVLGAVHDPEGTVGAFLTGSAAGDPDPALRSISLAVLRDYVGANPKSAARIHPELIRIARASAEPETRVRATASVNLALAAPEMVEEIARFLLEDPSPAVRGQALDLLAAARSDQRHACLRVIERAGEGETDPKLRDKIELRLSELRKVTPK